MATHRGSCLCGAIRWRYDGALRHAQYCHCRSCRKASGAAFAANATAQRAGFALEDPDGTLAEYESSPGKLRAFCSRCGSPLYAHRPDTPATLRIRLGTLDSAWAGPLESHIFVDDAAPWETITGDLPKHPGAPHRRT